LNRKNTIVGNSLISNHVGNSRIENYCWKLLLEIIVGKIAALEILGVILDCLIILPIASVTSKK